MFSSIFLVGDLLVLHQLLELLQLDLFVDQHLDRPFLGFGEDLLVWLAREAHQDHAHAVAHVGLRNHLVVHRGDHAIDHLSARCGRHGLWPLLRRRLLSHLRHGGAGEYRCGGKADREQSFHQSP